MTMSFNDRFGITEPDLEPEVEPEITEPEIEVVTPPAGTWQANLGIY